MLSAFADVYREHEHAAVLPLDLDHSRILPIVQTGHAKDGFRGNSYSRGLVAAVVNRQRVVIQPEILAGLHRSSHASGPHPTPDGLVDDAENGVGLEWLPHEGNTVGGFFLVGGNDDHGHGRKRISD